MSGIATRMVGSRQSHVRRLLLYSADRQLVLNTSASGFAGQDFELLARTLNVPADISEVLVSGRELKHQFSGQPEASAPYTYQR